MYYVVKCVNLAGWKWYDGKDGKLHRYPDSESLLTKEEAEKVYAERKKHCQGVYAEIEGLE